MTTSLLKNFLTLLVIFLFSFLLIPFSSNAQINETSLSDISKVKVDELTDEQIFLLYKKAEENGYTPEQLETAALAKGVPQREINKLKQRMNGIKTFGTDKGTQQTENRSRKLPEKDLEKPLPEDDIFNVLFATPSDSLQKKIDPRSRIFGYSLFNSENLTFEPSVNMPTPVDYQLGPGDELIIDIWGASQQNYQLTVSPDGFIVIDNIGPIAVNGLTIEAASTKIINRLSSIYSGLRGQNANTQRQRTAHLFQCSTLSR